MWLGDGVWWCVMSVEVYREKYRLRSRISMEWYSVLTKEPEKKEKKDSKTERIPQE